MTLAARWQLRGHFLSWTDDPRSSFLRILVVAAVYRFLLWTFMAAVVQILPAHDPGADVVRFDGRLKVDPSPNNRATLPCMAWAHSVCDEQAWPWRRLFFEWVAVEVPPVDPTVCAVTSSLEELSDPLERWWWRRPLQSIYAWYLTPLTRWDAARLLNLALEPQQRTPPSPRRRSSTAADTCGAGVVLSSESTMKNCDTAASVHDRLALEAITHTWTRSEQAHAFLPLFPKMVGLVGRFLLLVLPSSWLPSTCEGVLAGAAALLQWLVNLYTLHLLYHTTLTFLRQHSYALVPKTTAGTSSSVLLMTCVPASVAARWARRVTLLFAVHPALVFGIAAYTEPLAALLCFQGAAGLLLMGRPSPEDHHRHGEEEKDGDQEPPDSSTGPHRPTNIRPRARRLLLATFWWWAACWTRSNSVLHVGTIMLYGLGWSLQAFSSTTKARSWAFQAGRMVGPLIWAGSLAALLVLTSLVYYNYLGYLAHCHGLDRRPGEDFEVPAWCQEARSQSWAGFTVWNLYGYIQRRHWNVGLGRYYEWKQIPNFVLAAPILALTGGAVMTWIQHSWLRYQQQHPSKPFLFEMATTSTGGRRFLLDGYQSGRRMVGWAVTALQDFADDSGTFRPLETHETALLTAKEDREAIQDHDVVVRQILQGAPTLLGHYALLAATAVLLLTMAHVQIATRVLTSGSPFLYGYLATQLDDPIRGERYLRYCLFYHIVGAVMHPLWLPWT